jgi:hypothetical protein
MARKTGPRLGGTFGLARLFSKDIATLRELYQAGRLDRAVEATAITRPQILAALAGERIEEEHARVLRALARSEGARWVDLCPCGAEIHTGQGFQQVCETCYQERRRAQHRARTQRWREKAELREPAPKTEQPTLGTCSFCGAPLAKGRLGKRSFVYCRRRCVASDIVFLPQEAHKDNAVAVERVCADSRKARSLVGERFGILTVVAKSAIHRPDRESGWECLCDCGARAVVRRSNLLSGNTKSCGCLRRSTSPQKSRPGDSP